MQETFQLRLSQTGFILGPIVFVFIWLFFPHNSIHPDAYKVLAIASLMIIWWLTEALPLPVTALLPLVLFPATGVMSMSDASLSFGNSVIFLFLGGFMIAIAMERHGLHERLAYKIIHITGTSSNGIILGFLIATAFISMWISNTATALMMLPIAHSVIEISKTKEKPQLNKDDKNFALSLMLVIGYAASIGGMATIIGTPPNVVFVGLYEKFYHQKINFLQWMKIAFPATIFISALFYFLITKVMYRVKNQARQSSSNFIHEKLLLLGPLQKTEKIVLAIFGLTSFLWITQQPLNNLFGSNILNDTNIAIGGAILYFIIPVNFKKFEFVLHWQDTAKLPWGILLLFGGGLCLASGLEKTGIVQFIGNYVLSQNLSLDVLMIALIIITVMLSEIMSNVALVQVLIPVVFGIAGNDSHKALMMGIPVTLAASVGFMFPMATPPNAIVFGSGYIPIRKMVSVGFWLDVICIAIVYLVTKLTLPFIIS
ncbi:MAG TPA: SLC13 family permease [Bacteroidia bacterium]|nr:SLC13 family permease [Bacteroidia bacterium]